MSSTRLYKSRFNGANFSGAKLVAAGLGEAVFAGASFVGADLSEAKLRIADLRGADLSAVTLKGADLTDAQFDEKTRWPAGYRIPAKLKWKGKGVRPTVYRAGEKPAKDAPPPAASPPPAAKAPRAPIDFDTFMDRLRKKVDVGKLGKATAMLKKDRFRLFAEAGEQGIVGVVKSQSDADLVYACRLLHDGRYACCTQNLNVCGGLRGGLCKHLLVLVIGLAKSGQIDPALADACVGAGRNRNPELDKEAMSGTLLRYKGAEAGEVDWRPTETVPEDYYAL